MLPCSVCGAALSSKARAIGPGATHALCATHAKEVYALAGNLASPMPEGAEFLPGSVYVSFIKKLPASAGQSAPTSPVTTVPDVYDDSQFYDSAKKLMMRCPCCLGAPIHPTRCTYACENCWVTEAEPRAKCPSAAAPGREYFYRYGQKLRGESGKATPTRITKRTGTIAPEPPDSRLYDFFRAVPKGNCACNVPKHQCKYHG